MKKGNYTTTSETFQALEKRKEAVQNRREVITLGGSAHLGNLRVCLVMQIGQFVVCVS